jgi:hypothetical protein
MPLVMTVSSVRSARSTSARASAAVGGADVDDDRLAVGHEGRRRGGDGGLLVGLALGHLFERTLAAGAVERHRTAVDPERDLSLLEHLEVVAHGHRADAEAVGEVADADEPSLLQQLLDQDQAHLRGEVRVRKPPQTFLHFRYLSFILCLLSI